MPILLPDASLELVENKLHVGSDELSCRKEIFKKGPWKNFFLLECYRVPNINTVASHSTAFLTDLVRVEDKVTYATFLTAGHALFSFDRVVLKHSSDLLQGGDSAESVEPFIDLRRPHNKKKGWYEMCSRFKILHKHSTGPYDFGAIFIRKEHLEMKMNEYDMSLDDDLLTVRSSNLEILGAACPMFVAGYPFSISRFLGQFSGHLATSEGRYLPRKSLPDHFIARINKGSVPLPPVDAHTADTTAGMAGSPIMLGEFPVASSKAKWNVIAIHLGGVKVDGEELVWLPNAPGDLKDGLGVNLARPITKDVFEEFYLTAPDQFSELDVAATEVSSFSGEHSAGEQPAPTTRSLSLDADDVPLLSLISSHITSRSVCLHLALELNVSAQALHLIKSQTDSEYSTNTCRQVLHMWWYDQAEGQQRAQPLYRALLNAGQAVIAEEHKRELLNGSDLEDDGRDKSLMPSQQLAEAAFRISSRLSSSDACKLAVNLRVSAQDLNILTAAVITHRYTSGHSYNCMKRWLFSLPGDKGHKLHQALITIGRMDIATDEEIKALLLHGQTGTSEETWQSCQKAMKEERRTVRHERIIICGAGRVGKSSFCRSLFNEKYKKVSNSTAGLKLHKIVCTAKRDRHTKKWSWVEEDDKDKHQGLLLARALLNEPVVAEQQDGDNQGTMSGPQATASTETSAAAKQDTTKTDDCSPETNLSCQQSPHTTSLSEADASMPLDDEPSLKLELIGEYHDKVSEQLCEHLDELLRKMGGDDLCFVDLWDFAGQEAHVVIQHMLLAAERCAYVAMFNANLPLHQHTVEHIVQDGEERKVESTPGETNFERLEKWLYIIHQMVGSRKDVPAYVVGSHADLLSVKEQEAIKKDLEDNMENEVYNGNIDGIVFINNTLSGSDKVDGGVEKLRNQLIDKMWEQPAMKEPIDLSWLKFFRIARWLVEDDGRPWLTISEVTRIADQVCNKSSPADINEMLAYLHTLGHVLYYPNNENLSGRVIINIEWILRAVSCVCIHEPKVRKFRADYKLLHKKGVLVERLAKHIWGNDPDMVGHAKEEKDQTYLLHLMEQFSMLYDTEKKKPFGISPQPEHYFYMPAVVTSEPDAQHAASKIAERSPPLYLYCKGRLFPQSLFWCLVVRLMKQFKSSRDPILHRKSARIPCNIAVQIILQHFQKWIKVTVERENDEVESMNGFCEKLLPFIKDQLNELKGDTLKHFDCQCCSQCLCRTPCKHGTPPCQKDECVHFAIQDGQCWRCDHWNGGNCEQDVTVTTNVWPIFDSLDEKSLKRIRHLPSERSSSGAHSPSSVRRGRHPSRQRESPSHSASRSCSPLSSQRNSDETDLGCATAEGEDEAGLQNVQDRPAHSRRLANSRAAATSVAGDGAVARPVTDRELSKILSFVGDNLGSLEQCHKLAENLDVASSELNKLIYMNPSSYESIHAIKMLNSFRSMSKSLDNAYVKLRKALDEMNRSDITRDPKFQRRA